MSYDIWALHQDERWLITIDGWDARREPAVEAVLALVNGYLGTRAALEEGSAVSTPATFLNGVFDAATEQVAQAGATPDYQVIAAPTPELVVAPDWGKLLLAADGVPLNPQDGELLELRRTLDMRRGVLLREWRVRAGGKTTRLRSLRVASLADRHLMVQLLEITPEDWSGELTLEAIVDGDVTNEGNTRHLQHQRVDIADGAMLLSCETIEQRIPIRYAATASLLLEHGATAAWDDASSNTAIRQRWTCHLEAGHSATMHRLVTIWTGRDDRDPAERAMEGLRRAAGAGVATVLERSAGAWAERWASSDVVIRDDADIQRRTRFALYHLIGCANPDDEHASPGARALTGERYKGHVFWDTEIFVFPFFVYTHPPTARSLLMYRYHTLAAARDKAREFGYRGALYAWESTDSGVDVTPPFVFNARGERLEIYTGIEEHHISADIAYAIWQYWRATGDDAFMLQAGAEMLIELARFWASRAESGDDGRYHIRTVIGPDEFHEHTDDNAYTNVMAQWSMRRAIEVVSWVKDNHSAAWQAIQTQTSLREAELGEWRDVAVQLVNNFNSETRLIEQFRGYYELEPVDLRSLEPRKTTMDVLFGWEQLTRSQISKQADVVMLLFLLDDHFPAEVHEANFRFYEQRTSHDSSLSASFHALAAARLGDLALAESYFTRASNIDLDFAKGVTAAGGIHIAALGGMWQALVFGFGGMRVGEGDPRWEPHVPPAWGELRFPILWRDRLVKVEARGQVASVE